MKNKKLFLFLFLFFQFSSNSAAPRLNEHSRVRRRAHILLLFLPSSATSLAAAKKWRKKQAPKNMSNAGSEKLAKRLRLVPTQKKKKKQGKMRCEETRQFFTTFFSGKMKWERERQKEHSSGKKMILWAVAKKKFWQPNYYWNLIW